LLPDSFAMEVVMRMLRMETVQKDVLDGVEKTLRGVSVFLCVRRVQSHPPLGNRL